MGPRRGAVIGVRLGIGGGRRPAVARAAATLRVPETRAEQGAGIVDEFGAIWWGKLALGQGSAIGVGPSKAKSNHEGHESTRTRTGRAPARWRRSVGLWGDRGGIEVVSTSGPSKAEDEARRARKYENTKGGGHQRGGDESGMPRKSSALWDALENSVRAIRTKSIHASAHFGARIKASSPQCQKFYTNSVKIVDENLDNIGRIK